MARADLLLQLVEAALAGDQVRIRRIVEALSAEEQAKRHTVLADELAVLLDRASPSASIGMASPISNQAGLKDGLLEVQPKRRLHDLFLPEVVRDELATLVAEQHRADLLRAYNIEPRHRVLLVGPPGNGKTSCAEALATELAVPLLVLRYEAVITSFLGETSARLGAVLDDVRRRHCVLFLDEFDTLAKERGDEHDAGEIKRVVSTLLLQLDRLPAHVVICAATNHSELLDRAVWRRFQLRLELPPPNRAQRASYVDAVAGRLGLRLARSSRTIADRLGSSSYAEIEEFCVEIRRRELLDDEFAGGPAPTQVVDRMIAAWHARAGVDRPTRKSSLPNDD